MKPPYPEMSMRLRTLLAAIVESSDDAIISKTLEGTILSWNRAAEQIFGYKAEKLLANQYQFSFPQTVFREEQLLISRILARGAD